MKFCALYKQTLYWTCCVNYTQLTVIIFIRSTINFTTLQPCLPDNS